MIGFVVAPEIAASVLAGVEKAMTSRGLPNYWSPWLIQFTIRYERKPQGNPPLKPTDFPEFEYLLSILGGLDMRIDILPETIINSTNHQ
jgi:hypothetical protein